MFSGSKFSAILILLFAVPVCLKMNYILNIWLEEVPKWTVIFCQFQLIQTVIVQMANPLATAIYGNGNIKHYAIWKSIMNIMPIAFSVLVFTFEGSPVWLYLSLIIFMGIGGDMVILYYAKNMCGLSQNMFVRNVIMPVVGISGVMITFGYFFDYMINSQNFITLILCCLVTTVALIISLMTFGLTCAEKATMKTLIITLKNKVRH